MDVKEQILEQLTDARDAIRANMESKGENASGRTSASMRVEDRGGRLVLVMGGDRARYGRTAPLETLEIGSRPGQRAKAGHPDWFRSVIYQWTIDKGMSFESDSHRWAVSTIIARNIEESGTERHRNPVIVYSNVVEETMKGIRSILAQDFRTMMTTMIKSI